jgi:hypothetical protein
LVDHHLPLPPLTEEIREAARRRPGGWVYAVDPEFEGATAVPRRGIIGAWRVDGLGRLTGEFKHNPEYQPSSGALALPEPTDSLDATLQRAAYRRADEVEVLEAVLEAELWLPSSREPGLLSVPDDRGGWVIRAFSSREHAESGADRLADHAPEDTCGWQCRRGRDLAAAWPAGHDLEVNPGSPTAVRIPGAQLRRAAADRADA